MQTYNGETLNITLATHRPTTTEINKLTTFWGRYGHLVFYQHRQHELLNGLFVIEVMANEAYEA